MGILDDAIRQHLDLKRRQGAEEDELQRLEDEAFGPPSRPGDPEFGEAAADGEVAQAVEAPSTPAGAPTRAVDEPVEPPPTGEEPVAETHTEAPPEDETGEGAAFFDQSERGPAPSTDDQMALDSPEEPISEPHEVPISSLDTVEHPYEGEIEETGEQRVVEDEDEVEVVEGEVAEGERSEDGERSEEGKGSAEGERSEDGEDEDVLEETPEFLRDAPEDDELWFEQGEPKDFDF